MTAADDGVPRAIRVWAVWYTAGLPHATGAERRAEIDSDIVDHREARLADGWTRRRIAREQLSRTARGVPADVMWRSEILSASCGSTPAVRALVLTVTSISALAVAAFHGAFGAYLLGADTLAQRPGLRGLGNYAEEVGATGGTIAGFVVLLLGVMIVLAAVLRPVAPLTANLATIAIAIWSVLWFWLGMAPIAVLAVAGAIVDMTLRAHTLRSAR